MILPRDMSPRTTAESLLVCLPAPAPAPPLANESKTSPRTKLLSSDAVLVSMSASDFPSKSSRLSPYLEVGVRRKGDGGDYETRRREEGGRDVHVYTRRRFLTTYKTHFFS